MQMMVQIVRFRSALSDEEVLELYEARAPLYRALHGLVQKYYVRFAETREHGAVYVWESQSALREFRESDLAKSIPEAYQVEGEPVVQTAELVLTLRPHFAAVAP